MTQTETEPGFNLVPVAPLLTLDGRWWISVVENAEFALWMEHDRPQIVIYAATKEECWEQAGKILAALQGGKTNA